LGLLLIVASDRVDCRLRRDFAERNHVAFARLESTPYLTQSAKQTETKFFEGERAKMFLSQFGVKNYKCLGEIDIALTPTHVVIGPNDAGKTSLIEAIAALCGSLEKPAEELFPKPWQGRELVRFGAKEFAIDLRGRWLPRPTGQATANFTAGITYGLSVLFEQSSYSCRIAERWLTPDAIRDRGRPEAHFPLSPDLPARPEPFNIPWIADEPEQIQKMYEGWRDQSLGTLADIVKPVEKYTLDPKAMKMPAALDPERKFRLNQNGFGLPTLLDDILSYDSSLFEKIKAEFCGFFPQFTGVRLRTESVATYPDVGSSSGISEQAGKGIYLVSQGQEIRAQQASDGAILFLGILALAHLPEPPPLLLLEEPENGIYPKRLGEVISLLKQLVERTDGCPFPQIILSTHSPYVLSFFEPEEVTFLSRPPGKPDAPVRARPLRDAPHIRERMGKEFYLGELWYNLSEEELFDGK
jgi:hypothetical protein